jgi:hypothetical protein
MLAIIKVLSSYVGLASSGKAGCGGVFVCVCVGGGGEVLELSLNIRYSYLYKAS